jgi:desulfoferrodoxin-like iron-binding protein
MSIYVCKVCGHIEFNSVPDNCPVCFAPKTSFEQNDKVFIDSEEKAKEGAIKHIPSVQVVKKCGIIPEESCTDVVVRIGEKLHPAEEKHHIMFIDCYIDGKYISRVMLSHNVWPSALFHLKLTGSKVTVVEKCNVHGWWMKETSL